MSLTKLLINKVLKEVHPCTSITDESIGCLIGLFHKYDNMTLEQIINDTTGQLKIHAMKNDTKEKVIEYLLAEILELSGGIACDFHKSSITLTHLWIAILNDHELTLLFPHPIVPVIHNYDTDKYGCRKKLGKHYAPIKKTISKQFASANITLSSDARSIIYNLVFQCNLYFEEKSCIEKITALGKKYNENMYPLEQLRQIISEMLIERLKNIGKKITFTDVSNSVETMINDSKPNCDFLLDFN